MKVGLALEGLLVDIDSAFATWQSRQGGASSYMDQTVLRDESFWASLKPQCNSEVLRSCEDLYILTERPERLFLVTRSWLKRQGFEVPDENIIMQSSGTLKRYDCRLHGLDYYVDSDVNVLSTFRHDRTIPIGIGTGFPEWIRNFKNIESIRFEKDLRDWNIWNDEALREDGHDEPV